MANNTDNSSRPYLMQKRVASLIDIIQFILKHFYKADNINIELLTMIESYNKMLGTKNY